MLLLSTGTAAGLGQVNPQFVAPTPGLDKQYGHGFPPGFPGTGESADGMPCPEAGSSRDGIGLAVMLTAPPEATGFSFDWDFFTSEYPEYVCSEYNDVAAVFVDGVNVMIDAQGQAINVNSSLVDNCESGNWGEPPNQTGSRTCIGTAHLQNTGYQGPPPAGFTTDVGAASGWRTSTNGNVVITPGENYTFIFAIWDSTDGIWDSIVIFDHFRWTYD